MSEEENKPRMVFDVSAEIGWAAACAAQRVNGRYIKMGELVTTDTAEGSKPLPCNKELMTAFIGNQDLLTEEDFARGKEAREWYQGQLFSLIGDQLNDFMKKATETAVKDMINLRKDGGVLACLPQTWERAAKKERVVNTLTEAKSQHVGSITEKLVRLVHVIDVNQGVSFSGWVVTVTEGDNIFRFCSSFEFKENEIVRIQGKVKRHDFDKKTNTPVTWLNYVKKLS